MIYHFPKFCFSILCLILLLGCEDKEEISNKLSSVEVIYSSSNKKVFDIKYDGEKIIQFGNSTYSYAANGKLDKEVYLVGLNNPEHITGSADEKVTFQYSWDMQGRLISRSVVENTWFNPASIFRMYPLQRFFYQGNSSMLDKMDYYASDESLAKTVKFYAKGERLDSIVTSSPSPASPWNLLNTNLTVPVYKNIKAERSNVFSSLFSSLGFVPRDLDVLFQNDVLLLYVIVSAESYMGGQRSEFIYGKNNRLESMILSNKREIDGVITRSEDIQYKFNY